MKKLLSISCLTLLYCQTFGQLSIKEINASLVQVKNGLYASKYELSNQQYSHFLNSLKKSNDVRAISVAQIDTTNWLNKQSYNAPYATYYHAHPAYQNYPVVNISYEAATLYCEWLTKQYNSDPKRKFKKVVFRLPSEEEWMLAARAGKTSAIYGWPGNEIKNNKGETKGNFRRDPDDMFVGDKKHMTLPDVTAPVNSFSKNVFGLYNLSGNVAEMTNVQGIAKGGSWKDNPEALKIESKLTYDGKPRVDVGFRYFVEIMEE